MKASCFFPCFMVVMLVLSFPQPCSAGTLTIDGTEDLEIEVEQGGIRIKGIYEIKNHGDETAQNVTPVIETGSWSWVGKPENLRQGDKKQWSVDEWIELSNLPCAAISCPDAHNFRGVLVLKILRLYKDINGYQFSAADVALKEVGELSKNEQKRVRAPDVDAVLNIGGDGSLFQGGLLIRNRSNVGKLVHSLFHTSQELIIQTPSNPVNLKAGEASEVQFTIKNFRGLPGSIYRIYAVIEWEENGLHGAVVTSNVVKIEQPRHGKVYLSAIAISFFIASGVLLWAVISQRQFRRT